MSRLSPALGVLIDGLMSADLTRRDSAWTRPSKQNAVAKSLDEQVGTAVDLFSESFHVAARELETEMASIPLPPLYRRWPRV